MIAIIDDDTATRNALRAYLASVGYECETFASALSFLAVYRDGYFDCVLSDIRMPGMSGLELQEKILEASFICPMIFITADDRDEAIRDLAIGRGAVAFLGKPVALAELNTHIARATQRRRLE